jgi:hypothetical protein
MWHNDLLMMWHISFISHSLIIVFEIFIIITNYNNLYYYNINNKIYIYFHYV